MAQILEPRYNWRPGSTAWFVVTGQAPPVVTISGHALVLAGSRSPSELAMDTEHSTCTFFLRGAIWMSSQTVRKAYRNLQAGMLRQANRTVRERALTLLRFVEEEASNEGALPRWRTLVHHWNHAYPDWAYHTADGVPDVRTFARDYRQALPFMYTRA